MERTPKYRTSNTLNIDCPNIELSEHHILAQNQTLNMSNITRNWTVRKHRTFCSKTNLYAHICTTPTVVKTYFMSIITFQKNNAAVMSNPFSPSGHVLLVKNWPNFLETTHILKCITFSGSSSNVVGSMEKVMFYIF